MIRVLDLGLLHVIGAGIAARAGAGAIVGCTDAGAGRLFHAVGAGGIGFRWGGRRIGRAGLGERGGGQAKAENQGGKEQGLAHGRTPRQRIHSLLGTSHTGRCRAAGQLPLVLAL